MQRLQLGHGQLWRTCWLGEGEEADAFKALEDPAHRGPIGGFAHLVGNRLSRRRQLLAEPMFRQAIDQQAEHHHQAERHDTLRLLDKDRRGQEQGIFQKREAPLDARLLFVRLDQLLIGQHRGVQDVGGNQEARLTRCHALQRRRVQGHRGLDLPDRPVGSSVLARASPPAMGGMGHQVCLHLEPLRFFGELLGQGGLRVGLTGKALSTQVPERLLPRDPGLLRFAGQCRADPLLPLAGAHPTTQRSPGGVLATGANESAPACCQTAASASRTAALASTEVSGTRLIPRT